MQSLVKEQLVSEAHAASGFRCCLDQLADLEKDISPHVRPLLVEWLQLAEPYLSAEFRTRAQAEIAAPPKKAAEYVFVSFVFLQFCCFFVLSYC